MSRYECPECGVSHDSLLWSRCCSDECEAAYIRRIQERGQA